jgi:hypothetical protein
MLCNSPSGIAAIDESRRQFSQPPSAVHYSTKISADIPYMTALSWPRLRPQRHFDKTEMSLKSHCAFRGTSAPVFTPMDAEFFVMREWFSGESPRQDRGTTGVLGVASPCKRLSLRLRDAGDPNDGRPPCAMLGALHLSKTLAPRPRASPV